ncbi:hypothetical protein [Sporolactobacillus vineae]|nr:hypothetical protein [Sporolactobacillus vineae]
MNDAFNQQPDTFSAYWPQPDEQRAQVNPNPPENQENLANLQQLCRKYMNYHVVASMSNGTELEGIIEDMNDRGIVMLVPEDVDDDDRQFYGGRRRFRRFRRFLFPFFLFAFPFIRPFPHH